MPYTAQDARDHAEATRATSLPTITPGDLANRIKADLARCRRLRNQFDALSAKLHDVRPICGGSPEADEYETWARRVSEIYEGIDEDASPMTDADVADVNAIG
jgi:hypothetical protein